jgi:hypothetical protein
MTATRWTSLGMLAFALTLYVLSTTAEGQEAYVFPRIIALAMCLIALFTLVFEWANFDRSSVSIPWGKLWPALTIFLVYMLILRYLGFYASSFLVFFALGVIYTSQNYIVGTKRCLPISIAFMAVLYVIFVWLLRVQTPRGILF